MAKKQNINFSYRATDILTTKFVYNQIDDSALDNLFNNLKDIGFSISTTSNVDIENSKLIIDITTILKDKSNNEMLVEHTARTIYVIENLKEGINSNNEEVDLPTVLLQQMYGIAFSHARALLAVEISPTNFKGKYVLPIIDPALLIKDL